MEVCVDSVQSALNAEKGGATRVELCSNLMEGGTTPSLGMFRIIKQRSPIPVFVMIRPRGGDFLYTEDEFEVMKEDVKIFKEAGADGVVFGILTSEGAVDTLRCEELRDLASPLQATFHRAFDMLKDPYTSLEVIIKIGFERILTSGQDSSALEGLQTITHLIEKAKDRITIVPGGGITERNLERILLESGAREFHCSARHSISSVMEYRNTNCPMGGTLNPPEFVTKVASYEKVKNLVFVARSVIS
ncbi:copper homeostasis protein cutC homolog isoform X1 [Pocillopora verrucosa]|uniref:copper homeostasis protein cutC homolog isoform X1 n=2 Tax=Pocillopora verrucosa TaxID=203993 RepID=UPI002797433E|nr:copper homeostasis protein cutC homolog isoform X1 [Pocillopora verrucosa]